MNVFQSQIFAYLFLQQQDALLVSKPSRPALGCTLPRYAVGKECFSSGIRRPEREAN